MNRSFNNKVGKRTRRQHTPKEDVNEVATKLRTLLKLPKAHKWVIYEWFYGNIDQTLFGCNEQSEFQQCLKEIFPQLKTNKLRRVEWCQIRKLMGKPRRCSAAFFAEERMALKVKRDKIRQIQHLQKVDNLNNYRDLPDSIPMALVIGTRVTALQHKPHDGLFTGVIEAVDILNGTYRVTFDRPGIGADSVPDFECRSISKAEFMPLVAFQFKLRATSTNPNYSSAKLMQIFSDRSTSVDTFMQESNFAENSTVINSSTSHTTTSYPIKFLAQLVRLYKILDVKRRKIYDLKMMNGEIEKIKSTSEEEVSQEIQHEYASTLLELEKINKSLNESLQSVKLYSLDLNLSGSDTKPIDKRKNGAVELMHKFTPSHRLGDDKSVNLITNLLAIMLHLKGFNQEVNGEGIRDLLHTVQTVKSTVNERNVPTFEDNVEVHLNYLQNKIDQLGNLSAFMDSKELLEY